MYSSLKWARNSHYNACNIAVVEALSSEQNLKINQSFDCGVHMMPSPCNAMKDTCPFFLAISQQFLDHFWQSMHHSKCCLQRCTVCQNWYGPEMAEICQEKRTEISNCIAWDWHHANSITEFCSELDLLSCIAKESVVKSIISPFWCCILCQNQTRKDWYLFALHYNYCLSSINVDFKGKALWMI